MKTNLLESPRPNISLEFALHYAEIGLSVFPVHSIRDGRCTCGRSNCASVGKHPDTQHGFKDATKRKDQIYRWWKNRPDRNIGIRTGRGLLVLDSDSESGEKSLRALEEKYGLLPDSWQALSGKGRHLYFLTPQSITYVKSSSGTIATNIDIRADGGFIVAPPSIHYSGSQYTWEPDHDFRDVPIATAPMWLIEEANRRQKKSEQRDRATLDVLYKGIRTKTLLSEASHMRDLGMPKEKVRLYIGYRGVYGCVPPMEEKKIERIVDSAFDYEKRGRDESDLGKTKLMNFLLSRSAETGYCRVSKAEIAIAIGISKEQVKRCIKTLEMCKQLRVEGTGNENRYYPAPLREEKI
jgi:putative DNA primase/helicase